MLKLVGVGALHVTMDLILSPTVVNVRKVWMK